MRGAAGEGVKLIKSLSGAPCFSFYQMTLDFRGRARSKIKGCRAFKSQAKRKTSRRILVLTPQNRGCKCTPGTPSSAVRRPCDLKMGSRSCTATRPLWVEGKVVKGFRWLWF